MYYCSIRLEGVANITKPVSQIIGFKCRVFENGTFDYKIGLDNNKSKATFCPQRKRVCMAFVDVG